MKNYIKGNYIRSVFESSNGYKIGIMKITETNDPDITDFVNDTLTFTGYFTELNEKDTYILYGELIDHPKYGIQYVVNEYEKVLPNDKDGIIEFLSSNLFKGVGVKLAESIVKTLGENTLNLILEDKENLKKVPKINNKKIDVIYNTLTKYEESHETIVYLTELGFNMRDSLAIYNKYKSDTVLTLENNIYTLIDDIMEINFTKVDEIGKKLNYDLLDSRRIKACIIYIFKNLTFKNGDTYLYYDEIKDSTIKYVNQEIENFDLYLDELRFEGKIVLEDEKYYLKDTYNDEKTIVNKIKYLLEKQKDSYKNIDKTLKKLEEFNKIEYDEKQKESIIKSLENNILIITGGPGTGKTTIIKAIVDTFITLNEYTGDEALKKIALLAPTGRASKRMSESCVFPATTIHRYLKWNKETNSFGVDITNPNTEKLIIVDEVSMIDTNLLASLFRGLTDNIKLVLVGDYNQLPSVGPGQILKDLIESKTIETIELELLYRQNEKSYISKLAQDIKNNEVTNEFLKEKSDFKFLECNNILMNVKNLTKQILENDYNYKNFQILVPMYAGINGIDNLNKELQDIFNPKNDNLKEIKSGTTIFRENDKILQLVNMADCNVFNGDIGIIKKIIPASESDSKKNEIYIDYDGNEAKYLPKDFSNIKHGYAISIHKSQGSEFEFVLMPICNEYYRMLYKKLIYTGITRAKNKLIILGNVNAFLTGIHNNNEIVRKTNLKEKLENMYKNL